MNRFLLLLPALILAACGASPQTVVSSPSTNAPSTRTLGLYELHIEGGAGRAATSTVTRIGGGTLSAQELSGLSFTARAAQTISTASEKHLSVVVTVKNNGANIGQPTFVPVSVNNYTQNGTFFRAAQVQDGSSAEPNGIALEQAVTTSNGVVVTDSNATPLTGPIDGSTLTWDATPTGTSIGTASLRGWKSAALAGGQTQDVVFGLNLRGNAVFRVNLVFGVFDAPTISPSVNIKGVVYDDLNKDNVRNNGEVALKDWTVYLDSNKNGKLDGDEISTLTDANGAYSMTGVPQGNAKIGLVYRLGYATSGSQVTGQSLKSPDVQAQSMQPQIINGKDATASTAPFQANIEVADKNNPNASGRCGGSVIAPRWILTAAHCFVDKTSSANDATTGQVTVRVGVTDLNGTADTPLKVAQIINHPSYNRSTTENDIALVKLASPVPTTVPTIIPALASETAAYAAGTPARVSGWGKTEAGDTQQLKYVDQVVVAQTVCRAAWENPGDGDSPTTVTDETFCAGTAPSDTTVRDSCQGDSGGPLFTTSGPLRQLGVVSYGTASCMKRNVPGVYVRLPNFAEWLSANTGRNTADFSLQVSLAQGSPNIDFGVQQGN